MSINEAPLPYVVFRAKADGNRTRVGMYGSEDAAREAIERSIQRWRNGLDDVEQDELTAPLHSIWRGTYEQVTV